MWTLVLIVFITFTIGASDGIKSYLGEKMQDPSVNFISVEVSSNTNFKRARQKERLLNQLKDSLKMQKFGYDDVSVIFEGYLNLDLEIKKQVKYRLVEANSVFFTRYVKKQIVIPEPNNLLKFDDDAFGCIISVDLKNKIVKEKTELDQSYNFNDEPFLDFDLSGQIVPIPIIAVISALPNDNDILITQKFYNALNSDDYDYEGSIFDIDGDYNRHNNYLSFYSNEKIDASDKKYNFELKEDASLNNVFSDGYVYNVERGLMDYTSFDQIFNTLRENHEIIRVYDFTRIPIDPFEDTRIDYINFAFNNLDSVRSFKEFLFNDPYKLKLDISTVEAKEEGRILKMQ